MYEVHAQEPHNCIIKNYKHIPDVLSLLSFIGPHPKLFLIARRPQAMSYLHLKDTYARINGLKNMAYRN